MKDLFNNEIEVGATVAYGKGQSKTLLLGKVTKLNPKTVSIDGAELNYDKTPKRITRAPREVVVMPIREQ